MLTGVAAFAAVAIVGACGNSATRDATPGATSAAPPSASAQAAMHNKADMRFAHMMIPHHQQAIEMSDIILGKADIDPRVIDLAKQINAAQGPEIAEMQGWMKQWGMPGMSGMPGMEQGGMGGMPGMDHGGTNSPGSPTGTTMPMPSGSMMPGMGGMSAMDGMMSPAEMDALTNAQGVEASTLFLTGMIKHHQGALTMAQDEIANGEFPEAIAMAKSILESQQKEIDTMNQILASL